MAKLKENDVCEVCGIDECTENDEGRLLCDEHHE